VNTTLFDPGPPDPKKDDAPRPDSNGANAKDQASNDHTHLLLNPPAHHKAPPGTSGVAAARIAGHTAKQRAEVMGVIVRAGAFGATDAEIEAATGIRAQSISPRRGELRKLSLIVDSGERRLTPRGRPAAVWVAATFSTIIPATLNQAPKPEGGAA
jgi:hypothetical protein